MVPNNEEAEKGIIGCMIVDNSIINLVNLKEEDFFTTTYRELFKIIKNLYKNNKSVDLIILKDKLSEYIIKQLGDITGLIELTEGIHSANWTEYEKLIREKSHRRTIIKYAQEITNIAKNETEDFTAIFNKIDNVSEHIFDIKPKSVNGGMEDYIEHFEDIRNKTIQRGGRLGTPTLYPLIDKYTQGNIEGKVTTLVAYSNVGKSKFSYTYVCDELRKGNRVIYISLEVDKGMLFSNILASYYDKKYYDVLKEDFTYDISDFQNLEIYDNIYKLEDIVTLLKSKKPDYAVIDFIQNIQQTGTETEKMTKIAQDLQKTAIETNIHLLNISQANNDSRFKGGEAIQPKGSGAIFASSDVILALHKDNQQMYLTISKNKFGQAHKTFLLQPNETFNKFNMTEELEKKDF